MGRFWLSDTNVSVKSTCVYYDVVSFYTYSTRQINGRKRIKSLSVDEQINETNVRWRQVNRKQNGVLKLHSEKWIQRSVCYYLGYYYYYIISKVGGYEKICECEVIRKHSVAIK